ncbi:MAG: sialate O-acetylesterase [Bacteroidota bacterium]|nr:sialate O-acetylesterase [Bacteroidota bacterium]
MYSQQKKTYFPKLKNNVDLFILAGQSNAQGWRGNAAFYPEDKYNLDDSIGLNYTFINNTSSKGKWITMQPQEGLFPDGHFGPEVTLSRNLKKAGYNPAIFKYSLGGTSIYRDWKNPGQKGMYDGMVNALRNAIDSLVNRGFIINVRGFIWIQGESDAENDTMISAYYNNLRTMILDVRNNVVKDSSLPIILGVDEQHPWVKEHPLIVEIHKRIAKEEKYIAFTSMLGLPKADETHLTPEGLGFHGERLFRAFIQLAEKLSLKNEK